MPRRQSGATEPPPPYAPPVQERTGVPRVSERLLAVGFVAVASVVLVLGWYLVTGTSGSLTVTSEPAGAQVLIDGEPQGVTPSTIRVRAGDHAMEIRSSGPSQFVSLRMEKGGQVSRFFELPVGTAPATLHVTTTPADAIVTVDGRVRGRTPFVIPGLNPGPHHVRVESAAISLERLVMLESGANGVLDLSLAAPAGSPNEGYGWLSVSAPVEMQAFERDRLVGWTRAGPWRLPAGLHDLELVGPTIGARLRKSVDVSPGRTVTIEVGLPPGLLSITAAPAADIEIDGEPVGAAPIVRRQVAVGQHDVVAKHPVLGERRLTVTIISGATLSIDVELRRK